MSDITHTPTQAVLQAGLDCPIRPEAVKVTPEIAREWLDRYPFPYQRRAIEIHIFSLAEQMRRGTFSASTIDFAVTPDGKQWLVNGQHRLLALVESGCAIWFVVNYHAVRDFAEAAVIYSRFDSGRKRTPKNNIESVGADALLGSYSTKNDKVFAALRMVASGFAVRGANTVRVDAVLRSADVQTALIRDWADWAVLYLGRADLAHGNRFRKAFLWQSVMSVGIVTFRHAAERAFTFWARVATNDALKIHTPEHSLVSFLVNQSVEAGRQPTHARSVASAWNAAYEGRELRLVKQLPERIGPIRIAGTPYDGKETILDPVIW